MKPLPLPNIPPHLHPWVQSACDVVNRLSDQHREDRSSAQAEQACDICGPPFAWSVAEYHTGVEEGIPEEIDWLVHTFAVTTYTNAPGKPEHVVILTMPGKVGIASSLEQHHDP